MLDLTLAESEGDVLVRGRGLAAVVNNPDVTNITVTLAFHDEFEIGWWTTVECAWDSAASVWLGKVPKVTPPAPLIEVVECRIAEDPLEIPAHSRFHLFTTKQAEFSRGVQASAEASRLDLKRQSLFGQPLGSLGDVAAGRFAAIYVVDHLLVKATNRVPGIEIVPLARATLGTDVAAVLVQVAPELGFASSMEVAQWLPYLQNTNDGVGTALAVVRDIRARDLLAAHEVARSGVDQLLDLIGMLRDSRARLQGGVIYALSSSGLVTEWAPWIAQRLYRGNLIGGPYAGEDPRLLVEAWASANRDSRTQLWLSLYADALAEDRPDFRFFRCFGLLEAMAKEIVGEVHLLTDSEGQPMRDEQGQQLTSATARGKVFALLQLLYGKVLPNEYSFEAVGLWVKIRNSVAHEGAWMRPDRPAGTDKTDLNDRVAALTSVGSVEQGLRELDLRISLAIKDMLLGTLRGNFGKE